MFYKSYCRAIFLTCLTLSPAGAGKHFFRQGGGIDSGMNYSILFKLMKHLKSFETKKLQIINFTLRGSNVWER